jgi:hypothetical protein
MKTNYLSKTLFIMVFLFGALQINAQTTISFLEVVDINNLPNPDEDADDGSNLPILGEMVELTGLTTFDQEITINHPVDGGVLATNYTVAARSKISSDDPYRVWGVVTASSIGFTLQNVNNLKLDILEYEDTYLKLKKPNITINGTDYSDQIDDFMEDGVDLDIEGDVVVTLTNAGEMSKGEAFMLKGIEYTNNALALNKHVVNSLKTYPNPTNGSDILSINTSISKVEIFNITGAKVKSFENVTNGKLDISSLENGVYFLMGNDVNDEKYSGKIIKN